MSMLTKTDSVVSVHLELQVQHHQQTEDFVHLSFSRFVLILDMQH